MVYVFDTHLTLTSLTFSLSIKPLGLFASLQSQKVRLNEEELNTCTLVEPTSS